MSITVTADYPEVSTRDFRLSTPTYSLLPYQRRMIWALREYFLQKKQICDDVDPTHKLVGSPLLCLNDPIGSGKTTSLFGLLACGCFPTLLPTAPTVVGSRSIRIRTVDQADKVVQLYLIVVPSSLTHQYKRMVQDWTDLPARVHFVETLLDVDQSVGLWRHADATTKTAMTDAPVAVVVTERTYNRFIKLHRTTVWSVVVFDELYDICEHLRGRLPKACAYLLMGSRIDNILSVINCERPIVKDLIGSGTRRTKPFCIKTATDALQAEIKYPEHLFWYMHNETEATGDQFKESYYRTSYWENATTFAELVDDLCAPAGDAITLEGGGVDATDLQLTSDTTMERAHRTLHSQKECLRRQALQERISASADAPCPICLESFDDNKYRDRLVINCGEGHQFCFKCVFTLLQDVAFDNLSPGDSMFKCPTCRQDVLPGRDAIRLLKGCRRQLQSYHQQRVARKMNGKVLPSLQNVILQMINETTCMHLKGSVRKVQLNEFQKVMTSKSHICYLIVLPSAVELVKMSTWLQEHHIPSLTLHETSACDILEQLTSRKCQVLLMDITQIYSGFDGLQYVCDHWIMYTFPKITYNECITALGHVYRMGGYPETYRRVTTFHPCDIVQYNIDKISHINIGSYKALKKYQKRNRRVGVHMSVE